MDIEVTIKFNSPERVSESDLQLAVRLLAALGAKFPCADADAADKTKPA